MPMFSGRLFASLNLGKCGATEISQTQFLRVHVENELPGARVVEVRAGPSYYAPIVYAPLRKLHSLVLRARTSFLPPKAGASVAIS